MGRKYHALTTQPACLGSSPAVATQQRAGATVRPIGVRLDDSVMTSRTAPLERARPATCWDWLGMCHGARRCLKAAMAARASASSEKTWAGRESIRLPIETATPVRSALTA